MRKNRKQKKFETIIGKDTIIEGKIKLPTSLRIEGKVYGEIESEGNVIIGKSGYAEPAIQAKNLIVAGKAKGDFQTKEKIHIYPRGEISGSVTAAGIVIEDGGVFNGTSSIYAPEADKKKTKKKLEPIHENK